MLGGVAWNWRIQEHQTEIEASQSKRKEEYECKVVYNQKKSQYHVRTTQNPIEKFIQQKNITNQSIHQPLYQSNNINKAVILIFLKQLLPSSFDFRQIAEQF